MNVKQSLTMALKSLMSSKMRSFLTMLGIIIGVAAVIVIVSVINGVTSDVLENFESLGATNITVSIRGRGGNRSVDVDDMQNLVDENPTLLKSMSPSVTVSGASIKSGSETLDTTSIKGVGEKTEQRLLLRYGSVARIASAPLDDLSALVGPVLAVRIKETLKPE